MTCECLSVWRPGRRYCPLDLACLRTPTGTVEVADMHSVQKCQIAAVSFENKLQLQTLTFNLPPSVKPMGPSKSPKPPNLRDLRLSCFSDAAARTAGLARTPLRAAQALHGCCVKQSDRDANISSRSEQQKTTDPFQHSADFACAVPTIDGANLCSCACARDNARSCQ